MGKVYLHTSKKCNFSAYGFDTMYVYLRTSLDDLQDNNQKFLQDLNSIANAHKNSGVNYYLFL